MDITGPNPSSLNFLYLFFQICLNNVLHCSPHLIGPCGLPDRFLDEMNFCKVLSNLKIDFLIVFNLVSKFASCYVAATHIPGAGFMLTLPDAEEIAVVVIIEREVKVTRVLLLAAVIGTVP